MAPATQLQTALLDQVNALRVGRGLSRLRLSSALTAAANAHSAEMARVGYFSHNSANGASFSSRIGQFYPLRGFHSWTVGENLVWGAPDIGALRAFKLWLGSPPHRANLLAPRWREIGISAMHSTKAPGLYGGRPAHDRHRRLRRAQPVVRRRKSGRFAAMTTFDGFFLN